MMPLHLHINFLQAKYLYGYLFVYLLSHIQTYNYTFYDSNVGNLAASVGLRVIYSYIYKLCQMKFRFKRTSWTGVRLQNSAPALFKNWNNIKIIHLMSTSIYDGFYTNVHKYQRHPPLRKYLLHHYLVLTTHHTILEGIRFVIVSMSMESLAKIIYQF